MKKIFYGVAIASLIVAASVSCKKSNPVSCEDKSKKVSDAADAYGADGSKEHCVAYKAAIQDYLNSCAGSMSASQKEQFQAMIDGMDCQ